MRRLLALFSAFCLLLPNIAAAEGRSMIRDAELEHTLRVFGTPIWKAADLNPDNVHIFIVHDDSINAYVAGGANIFIHTGLLLKIQNTNMLIGVIAHETGHIAGGHIARGAEQVRNAQIGAIMSYVLGAAVIAGGGGQAGAAVIGGGSSAIQRTMLSFSRANEDAADQGGMSFLDKLGISASGMLQMFELLRSDERKFPGNIDPYMITHPLSTERISNVRNHLADSKIPEGEHPKEYDAMFARLQAKLYAFMELPPKTLARYSANDKTQAARMGRAIAYYKIPDVERAVKEMDGLIKESPNDPFLHELKGQILFENGKAKESLAAYRKAVNLLPNNALILTSAGEVDLANNEVAEAIRFLEKSTMIDNSNPGTWRLLAKAYGLSKNEGMVYLALSEEAALTGEPEACLKNASLASQTLTHGSPGWLRAEDLKLLAAELKKQKEDRQ